MNYGGGSTPLFHETVVPTWHPFLSQMWNGTCDQGQLTAEGLADAIQHGKVRSQTHTLPVYTAGLISAHRIFGLFIMTQSDF